MNELQIFNNEEFGQVRSTIIDNEPWFVGNDVAEALGYKIPKNAIRDNVSEEDKMLLNAQTQTVARSEFDYKKIGQRGGWIINESGLYALIFRSRLETAERFKHWVTKEVLPTIRKTGGYVNNDDLFIQTYLPYADEGTKTLFKTTLSTMRSMSKQLEEQKPLVEFAKTVQSTDTNILVRECSKLASNYIGLDIGEKRLYERLRKWNLVLKKKNEPTQLARNMGVLELIERAGMKNGMAYVAYTTKVTPKGQVYIINRLIDEYKGCM